MSLFLTKWFLICETLLCCVINALRVSRLWSQNGFLIEVSFSILITSFLTFKRSHSECGCVVEVWKLFRVPELVMSFGKDILILSQMAIQIPISGKALSLFFTLIFVLVFTLLY